MRPFVIAANWKMFKTPDDVETYFTHLKKKDLKLEGQSFIFFVSPINVPATAKSCAGTQWGFGCQNTHFKDEGAYTGETSPATVAALGATYGLVGHSERRALFNEGDALLSQKIQSLLNHQMIPVFCIGETLEQRQAGKTLETLQAQLEGVLKDIPKDCLVHIAYEPVWAIGTGEVASKDQIEDAHGFIRKYLDAQLSRSSEIAILYGGSVKPENAEELSKADEVGGFLIGSASLTVDSLSKIVEASQP